MSAAKITGSAVGRVMACPPSAALPQSPRTGGAYADEGVSLHADAEVAVDTGDLSSLPARAEAMIADLPYRHTEVVFVYDAATDTARLLADVTGRAYPATLGPFEIPMTLDLLALSGADDPRRRAVVIDHKLYSDQGDPLQHGQLMTQALAVARVHGLDEVTIAISYLGTGWVDHAVATAFDLDVHAARLQQMFLNVAVARGSQAAGEPQIVHRGKHCKYCPAFDACPEQLALLALVRVDDPVTSIAVPMMPLTDDAEALAALDLADRVKALYTRLHDAVSARAREAPIPLGGGRWYGPVPQIGNKVLDGEVVYATALELVGREDAVKFVEVRATATKIKAAAKTVRVVGGVRMKSAAAVERAIMARVEERGGVKRRDTSYPLKVYEQNELIETTAAVLALPAPSTNPNNSEES